MLKYINTADNGSGKAMVFIQSDIRISKTHSALAGTLLELLGKKRFCKITANDICRNAMVSRSVFYMHFEDKYQLLQFCMQKERERLENALTDKDVRSLLYAVLKSVKERQTVYHNLFMAEVNAELIQMFLSLFRDFFQIS